MSVFQPDPIVVTGNESEFRIKEIADILKSHGKPVCAPIVGLPHSGKRRFLEISKAVFENSGIEIVDSEELAKEGLTGFAAEFECRRRMMNAISSGRSVVIRRGANVPDDFRHAEKRALEMMRNEVAAKGGSFVPLFVMADVESIVSRKAPSLSWWNRILPWRRYEYRKAMIRRLTEIKKVCGIREPINTMHIRAQ